MIFAVPKLDIDGEHHGGREREESVLFCTYSKIVLIPWTSRMQNVNDGHCDSRFTAKSIGRISSELGLSD